MAKTKRMICRLDNNRSLSRKPRYTSIRSHHVAELPTSSDLFHVEHLSPAAIDAKLAQLQRLASVGILAGSILHEINNALTPAMTYSELALADPANQELTRKALQRTLAGIRHATDIATATLNLVRSTQNTVENRPSTQVSLVVNAAVDSLMPLAKRAGVRIQMQCPAELTASIHAVELQQVLINLLSNSLRATLRGGTVEVKCSTWNTTGAQIEVQDDGPGVNPAIRSQLFQPLASYSPENSVHSHGHGLGLMISRRLIEAVGGELVHDADFTAGARFIARIP